MMELVGQLRLQNSCVLQESSSASLPVDDDGHGQTNESKQDGEDAHSVLSATIAHFRSRPESCGR